MASTVRSGAIYGVARYGQAKYGSINLAYTPDGLQTSSSVGTVGVIAKANIPLTGVGSVASVGSPTIRANASVPVTGVSATYLLGTAVARTVNYIYVTGLSATSTVGTVIVQADANTVSTGSTASSYVGVAVAAAKANVVATGASTTAQVGTVTYKLDCNFAVNGLLSQIICDAPDVIGDEPSIEADATTFATGSSAEYSYGDVSVIGESVHTPDGAESISETGIVDFSLSWLFEAEGANASFEQGEAIAKASATAEFDGSFVSSYVGSVGVIGKARPLAVGAGATYLLGTPSLSLDVVLTASGLSTTTAAGNATTIAKARAMPSGIAATSAVGTAYAKISIKAFPAGASVSTSVGSVSYKLGQTFTIQNYGITGYVGDVTFNNTEYVYVAENFDRQRVVYVERKPTFAERTAYVEQENRTILVERKPTSYERTVSIY